MTTSAENIKSWLCQSVDKDYYETRFSLMQKAFDPARCFPWAGGTGSGHRFPDFPDLKAQYKEIGTEPWILEVQLDLLAEVMRSTPEPEFPDVDEFTGQVRQAFWKKRNKGYGRTKTDGLTQMEKAWLDGHGLGIGFVQWGIKTNPKNGYRYVCPKHVPMLQMIWDRNARSFCEARMACAMSYMPYDQAKALFKGRAEDHKVELRETNTDEPLQVVRVFEYYDLGYEGGEPTSAIILGDITNEAFQIDENAFECLPFAYYEHILTPGFRRPIGAIDILVAGQEGLHQIERSTNAEVKRPGFDLMSPDILNDEDIARVESGEHGVVVRTERPLEPGEAAYQRVAAGEVSQTTLAVYQMRKESFMAKAGISNLDRGQDIEGADTLGEVQLADSRSGKKKNRTIFQTALFFQRNVEVFMQVAKLADDEPVMLDVGGENLPFNDPSDPVSLIAGWLEEDSDVVISEESLTKGDLAAERMEKIQRVSIFDMDPLVDPIWRTEEKLKAAGFDPKKAMAMNQMEAMPGQAAQMGQDPNAQPQVA
jgi:hypothetical protein